MRILLSAKHAPHGSRPIGGVQSYCRTVGRELEKRGHEVETWGPEQPVPLGGFDLGIIANVADTSRALEYCRKNLVVCHGIIPAEKPIGDHVVYTSEEVRDHWGGGGAVIRQPIDLDFWRPNPAERIYLTRFSYRSGLKFIPQIAKSMHLQYQHIRNLDSRGVREILRKSRCVIATGRAALEAMAVGVPVVIADHRSAYQGPLMDLDIEGSAKRNYSGRGGITPTLANVTGAINAAISRGSMREYVEKHHDVVDIVDQLLDAA